MPQLTPKETLFINLYDSKCGNCGLGCDPMEVTHSKVLGYGTGNSNGCGVAWKYVSSHYTNMEEKLKSMRPDLIIDQQYAITNSLRA